MGQFSKVLLATDKVHSTAKGPGLQTRLRWVKPGLWAQPFNSLCLEYLWQINQHLDNIIKVQSVLFVFSISM